MGYFDELDKMIECYTEYDHDRGINEDKYIQLKNEIGEHCAGNLDWDQLSPDAKQVLADWESYIADMTRFDYQNQIGIGPLDV